MLMHEMYKVNFFPQKCTHIESIIYFLLYIDKISTPTLPSENNVKYVMMTMNEHWKYWWESEPKFMAKIQAR